VQLDVFNMQGSKVKKISLSDGVFAVPINESVVHQALLMQRANKRLGTADTETRGEVKRSSKKLYAQKHTGRARRGAADSPVMVGGGVAFGPHPRSYRQAMPKKMRRLAIKSVLSDKAGSGTLKIVDKFEFDAPQTRKLQELLIALGIDSGVLIATTASDKNLIKSAENLAGVETTRANLLNVTDMLSFKVLLMSEEAAKQVDSTWGEKKAPAKKAAAEAK
jgi:large subunit ribosomal protein L4